MIQPQSSETEERSRLLTLVFTDLVDSVGLKTRLGDAEAGRLISAHQKGLRSLCAQAEGREILAAGDGCFLTFETSSQAVEFALRLQEFHREHSGLPEVRIGIHMGEVTERILSSPTPAGRTIEVEGLAVDIASRIQSLAQPRQILMSYPVFDNARQRLDNAEWSLPVEWRAHGRYVFQGTDMALEVFEVGLKGISPFIPPTGGSKAQRDVEGDEEQTLGWRPAQGLEMPDRANWVLVKKLGEGGFGDVWLAEHRKTHERHVIKFCYSSDRLRTLKREVTLFRLLKESLGDRQDIARVLDYQFEKTPYFLEMEFAGHHTLTAWLEENGGVQAIPLETRLEIVAQVADAIAAAHSVGVLHKDIKPSNIMVTGKLSPKPSIRMIDFGIGAVADRNLLSDKGITATGLTEAESSSEYGTSMTGTRLYMAPELIEGKPATTKSDIYSLGVLLYQLASGKLGQSLAFGWERDIPDEILREDIEACVDGRPENRLVSAEDLAYRLRNLPERRAKRHKAMEDVQRLAQAKKRRHLLYGAVALLAVLFIIIAQYAAIQAQKANAEELLRKKAELARIDAQAQTQKTQEALSQARQAQYFGAIALAESSLRESRLAKVQDVLLNQTPHEFLKREWGWLLAQTAPEDLALKDADIFDAQFMPDGKHFVAGNRDEVGKGHIRVYEAGTGKLISDLMTNDRLVWNLALSPDGKTAATASSDRKVTLINLTDLTSPTIIRKLNGGRGIIRDVQFSPDGNFLASISRDQTIRIWETKNFSNEKILRLPDQSFTELAFSPDSRYFVVGSLEGSAEVFETSSTKLVCDLAGHEERVLSVAFLRDGKGVVTAGSEGITRIFPWPPDDGNTTISARLTVRSLSSYPAQVVSSIDGKHVYIGNDNGEITKVNSTTGDEQLSLRVDQPLWKMSICNNGERLLTSARWSMRMLDLKRLEGDVVVKEWPDTATLPPNAQLIPISGVSLKRDQTWKGDEQWRTTSGLTLVTTTRGKEFVVQSDFDTYSPDRSQHIKIDPENLSVTVYSTTSGEILKSLQMYPTVDAVFSPDGKQAAFVLDALGTALYETGTWTQTALIPKIEPGPTVAIYTPDSKSVIVGYIDGTINSYDAATGEKQTCLFQPGSGMTLAMDISDDGTLLAIGLDVDRAIVIDLQTGQIVSTMYGHVRYVFNLKFTSRNERLTTLSRDGTVKLWDVETGRELVTLFNLQNAEIPLGISLKPNGREITIATSQHRVVSTEVFPWNLEAYSNDEMPLEDRLELWKRRQRLDPTMTMQDVTRESKVVGPPGLEPGTSRL